MAYIDKITYNGTPYDVGSGSGSGMTNEAKQALLNCFEKVAWVDAYGQDYYDALYAALYPPANLVSISCVYTQSGTVYDTDSLDSLKTDLVVTAHYDDSSTGTVTAYTLSGTLTSGTSTITVSYGGKTATFTVTVTHLDNSVYNWDFTTSTTDSKQSAVATLGSGVTQSSSGLTFDGTNNGWVYLASISSYKTTSFTVEVDITTLKKSGELCLVDLNNNNDMSYNPMGVLFTNNWVFRSPAGSNYSYADPALTDYSIFDGHTLKLQCDYAHQKSELFLDSVSLGSTTNYTTGPDYLGLSAKYSNRYVGSGTIITAVRVYEGVV